ncbi:hypothetical protein GCM10010409_47640 [Mycolicibacterium diernhoferi]
MLRPIDADGMSSCSIGSPGRENAAAGGALTSEPSTSVVRTADAPRRSQRRIVVEGVMQAKLTAAHE